MSHEITLIKFGTFGSKHMMGYYRVTSTNPYGYKTNTYIGLDEIVWC